MMTLSIQAAAAGTGNKEGCDFMAIRWKGMTAEQLLIKREIDRINRQIRQAATVFGTESGLYKHYLTLIAPNSQISFGHDMVRENKQGIIQLSVSRKSIVEMQQFSQYGKRLQQLGKVPTVQQTRQEYLKTYEQQTGRKVKGKREAAKAISEVREQVKGLFYDVSTLLEQYYTLEKKQGGRFKNHSQLKAMSKGYRSGMKDLQAMKDMLEKTIAGEDNEIVKNVLEGY